MDSAQLIEQLAANLGVNPETVRKWRQRGIPYYRRDELREAASQQNRILTREHFDRFKRSEAA